MKRRTHISGMTLIEMLAAITVLMILTAILAEVFFQATKASSQGKAVAEVYQVGRALRTVLARDLSGATRDFFESGQNGIVVPFSRIYGLPLGPFYGAFPGAPLPDPDMRRMLAGGSDYLVMTSSSASSMDKGVCKVYYVLRETGQLIRVVNSDQDFAIMDYAYDALENNVDINSANAMGRYEDTRILAENVARLKLSFLDRSNGPVSQGAQTYANGIWLEDWDWNQRPYLPVAVKVQLQLVDHLWNMTDGDRLSNKNFDYRQIDDTLRASEFFDSEDGEPFSFIIDLPLGMRGPGS